MKKLSELLGMMTVLSAIGDNTSMSLPRKGLRSDGNAPESTANRTHKQTVKRKKLRRITAKAKSINRRIAAIFIGILLMFNVNAQTVTKDANGNYHSVVKKDTATTGKPTGKIYTDPKGRVYPVFESARGARFVMKQKKDSTYYKMYMPKS